MKWSKLLNRAEELGIEPDTELAIDDDCGDIYGIYDSRLEDGKFVLVMGDSDNEEDT